MLENVIGKPHNLWLGGNDDFNTSRDKTRSFYWMGTGKKFNFTYWSQENPDNLHNREHCVQIWSAKPNYKWNDEDCTKKMGFICETHKAVGTFKENMKYNCNGLNETTTSIIEGFNGVEKSHNALNALRTQNITAVGVKLKQELETLLDATETLVMKKLQQQRQQIRQVAKNMLQRIETIDKEQKTFIEEFNQGYREQYVKKQNYLNKMCDL